MKPAADNRDNSSSAAAYYITDAVVFILIIFQGVQNNLLWREGLYSPVKAVFLNALMLCGIFILHGAHSRFGRGKPRRAGAIIDILVFFALTVPPALLTFITPQKGKPDFAWLPLEWHKLPENVVLLAKITPGVYAAELAAAALLIYFVSGRKTLILARIASIVLFITVFRQLFTLSKESNLVFYFFQYASMPMFAAAAAILNKPRVFSRALMAATFTTLLLWQYIGAAPVNPRPDAMPDASISVIYPQRGVKPGFPLVFFRDFYVDSKRNTLYTAYGPTSGLVRIDLSNGAVKIAPTHAGLVRYLWTRDNLDVIYAIDWIRCDLLVLKKAEFTYSRRSIYRTDASIPLSLEIVGDKLYITTTELPGLTEYDLETMKITRRLNLMPYTKFRSGVWRMAYDKRRDALFIEAGYTDLRGRNTLLRVDRKSLKVDGSAEVPAGGLELLVMPKKRRIVSASFFTTSLWEFDMDSMRFIRRIEGPINCRNMAYDDRRDLIYASSFLGGDLRAIRYSDGKTLRAIKLGNKASSLFLSPDAGRSSLYLGNSWGVLKVDLEKFLRGASAGL